ncbi:protein spaetzle 3-like isoform X2 [Artemia franciscana]|uniref:protein spaetzle 3-like isoform X2 n=1 Tax=Artemia franciscana TaxID=6661 RepID=UPI0032DA8540
MESLKLIVLVQTILWTALSVALGVEVKGEIIRGLPCIKRLNQLFCPTAGNRYPTDKIEKFIDDNKALIRRMYGEFQTNPNDNRRSSREKRSDVFPDFTTEEDEIEIDHDYSTLSSMFKNRSKRQAKPSSKTDSCESTVEVVTPFWAANSSGKIRAVVNTQHFEQAIHQEVCQKAATKRCSGECTCEQKYKWHRLLAYDPDNDCKGIFMDWFLFPSCCVCRCSGP